jgi:hypothetical protein
MNAVHASLWQQDPKEARIEGLEEGLAKGHMVRLGGRARRGYMEKLGGRPREGHMERLGGRD